MVLLIRMHVYSTYRADFNALAASGAFVMKEYRSLFELPEKNKPVLYEFHSNIFIGRDWKPSEILYNN